jgi:hypothetical protein
MSELSRVLEDMERAVREHEARAAGKVRFKRQVAATDQLLDLLEGMNLRKVEFVGRPAATRIARTLAVVPSCVRPTVGPTTRVQRALDRVFDLQKALFIRYARRGMRSVPAEE